MVLEKRLEITYRQAQGQPIGAWWKSSGRSAKTGTWRDETLMPTFFLTFIMRLTKPQHLPIKCSDSLIAWQESSQKKEECSITPAVGLGGGLVFTEKSWRRKMMKSGQWEGVKVG